MFAGLHGTSVEIAEKILRTGFRPGCGLHQWEAPGTYFFQICDDPARDAVIAFRYARDFAEEKYGPNVGVIWAEIDDTRYLDLQHPDIHAAIQRAEDVLRSKMGTIGLVVEANDDWVRPEAHFFISAFLLILETLTQTPIHVVGTEFSAQRKTTIEPIRNRELCVRNPAALSANTLRLVKSPKDIPHASKTATQVPTNWVLRAAHQVAPYVELMDDNSFADLVFKIAEGARSTWHSKRRFTGQPVISIIIDGPSRIASDVESIAVKLTKLPRAQIRTIQLPELLKTTNLGGTRTSGPEKVKRIETLIKSSSGIIAISDTPSLDFASTLSYTKHHDRPLAVLSMKDVELPCEILSVQNVSVFKPSSKREQRDELLPVLKTPS